MKKCLMLLVLLITTPLAAQTSSPTDQGTMSGMNHGNMAAMNHDAAATPATSMPMMDHSKMEGMNQAKMGGMGAIMKNTPANPYAEAGMAMHHKMMVSGADASETWVRQMIELDRGAIAMSKIAATDDKDKEVRTMAQSDIAAREKQVASLQSWLKRHGDKPQ